MKKWFEKNGIRLLLNAIISVIIVWGLYHNSSSAHLGDTFVLQVFLLNLLILSNVFIQNLILIPQYLLRFKWFYFITFTILSFTVVTFLSSLFLNYLMVNYPGSGQCSYSNLPVYLNDSRPFIIKYFRTYPHVTFYTLAFMVGYFVQYGIRKVRTKKQIEARQKESELMLLKSQVNPHFLFNMMNTIYSLSIKKADENPEIILKLSEILRYNLYETNTNFVLLSKELKIIESYIDLERIRLKYPERVSFENDVRTSNIEVAPLLMLPLVENAFKHGIDSNIEQGFIKMIACEDGDQFKFICRNNYKQVNKKNKNGGLGLQNLRQRLELVYPNRHDLVINKSETDFEVILTIKLSL